MRPQHRLRSTTDFRRVLAQGGREVTPQLVVHHLARDGLPRVGFAIGRSIGGAVVRNRVRRRLREAVRPLVRHLGGCDLVVVARPGAEAASVEEFAAALRDVAAKTGLLRA